MAEQQDLVDDEFTQSDLEDYKEIFGMFVSPFEEYNEDEKPLICVYDIGRAMRLLDKHPSSELLTKICKDQEGYQWADGIDFEEFIRLIKLIMSDVDFRNQELIRSFKQLNVDD